jgi:hypothetical protein
VSHFFSLIPDSSFQIRLPIMMIDSFFLTMDRWTGPWRPSGSLGIGDSTWTFELWPDTPTELTFQFPSSDFYQLPTANVECVVTGDMFI